MIQIDSGSTGPFVDAIGRLVRGLKVKHQSCWITGKDNFVCAVFISDDTCNESIKIGGTQS